MRITKNALIAIAVLFSNTALAYDVNWTAEISSVFARNDNSVGIYLSDPRDPNPIDSDFGCSGKIAALGHGMNDVNPSNHLVSMAVLAHTTQRTVRIGISHNGTQCSVYYITVN